MSSDAGKKSFARPAILALALTLVLAAWLYAPALKGGFVMFDDDVNIYGNPNIGEITRERVAWACSGFEYMPRIMPVAWLALMGIFELAGMDPAAYHAFNLGLHLVNGALVFALVRLVLGQAARAEGGDARRTGWTEFLAWAAAAAWLLHPLRSESVAWATGWIYPLVTFFALAATGLALRRREETGWKRRCLGVGAVLAYLLCVLVYPVALGLPAALLAYEWWLRRGRVSAAELARVYGIFVLIAALALAGNVWARVAKNEFYPPAPGLETFTVEKRVAQAARALVYYPLRALWAGETSPVYDQWRPGPLFSRTTAPYLVLLFAWVGWVWSRRRAAPGWLAWTLAYAAVAGPMTGLLDYPFQTSDRYGYLAGVVLVIGLALAARGAGGAAARRWAAVVVGWVAWLAAAVPAQVPKWRDTEALLGAVRGRLSDADGKNSYGTTLAVHRARRGDFAGARALMVEIHAAGWRSPLFDERMALIDRLEALARQPDGGHVPPDAMLSRRLAERDARAGEDRGARFRYLQALEQYPDYHDARFNFVLFLAGRGRAAEAWAQYVELVRRAGTRLGAPEAETLRRLVAESAAAVGDESTGRAAARSGREASP